VLKLTMGGRSILFTGDIQEAAMRELLRRPEMLKCDVLVAPHHGSSELATAEFVAAANPTYILSSNDATLSQKQKKFETLVGGRAVYRTHCCGAITVSVGADGGLRCETFLTRKSVKP
jgi:competence protein ComEC